MKIIHVLRVTAFLEGISFLLLVGICMPLKYFYNMPEPNKFVGMAHGVLFVMYCVLVILAKSEKNWTLKQTFLALIASVLPFGTFVADKKLFR
jgi:integral membrane protein